MSTKSTQLLLLTSTAIGGFLVYKFLTRDLAPQTVESCPEHKLLIISENQMKELIEDLKIQLVPYYHHYYNLLREMEREFVLRYKERDDPSKDTYGLRSKTLQELKSKVRKELDAKQLEIQTVLIEDTYRLTKEKFIYSSRFYQNGTTDILAAGGYPV